MLFATAENSFIGLCAS